MRGRLATALILAAAVLSGCGGGAPEAPRVTAEEVLITLPAVAGRPGAAYFTLETNHEGTRLTGIASPAAARIELHEAGMRPAASFALSPSEPLHFTPGGRHAMLFEVDPALRPGGRVAVTFTFDGAPPVAAEAELRAPGDVQTDH